MNKLIVILVITIVFFLSSCLEDKELGQIDQLTQEYELPQGKSPADNQIVELYNRFGSYFLYEFSKRDFEWTQVFNSSLKDSYVYTPADPL